MWVCMGGHACHLMHVKVRWQLWESVLSAMWDPGSNSGHLAWRQVFLAAEPSHWSWVGLLNVVFPRAREMAQAAENSMGAWLCWQKFLKWDPFSQQGNSFELQKKKLRGDPPQHDIRVDANLLSVEYLTCYLHSCLSKINPRVLLFED